MKQQLPALAACWIAALLSGGWAMAAEESPVARPALEATVGRNDETPLKFAVEGEAVVFDVPKNFDISPAKIKRLGKAWPKSIRVRLHLQGLELFAATAGKTTVEWSIASSAEKTQHMSLRLGDKQLPLDEKSPYYTAVLVVAPEPRQPLKADLFEVTLPDKLLEGNPAELTLFWVDFYRE